MFTLSDKKSTKLVDEIDDSVDNVLLLCVVRRGPMGGPGRGFNAD